MGRVFWGLAIVGACRFEPGVLAGDSGLAGDAKRDSGNGGDAGLDVMLPAPLCDPGNSNLRACYTFDNNTQDGSSSNNDITASGMSFAGGHTGEALVTASGTATVAGTSTLNMSAFTIDMWIRPAVIPSVRAGLLDSAGRYRLFLQPGGALRCAITGGADLTTAMNVVGTGTFQRVTCTYSGTQMRIYVSGTMVDELASTSTVPSNTSGMVVGHNNPDMENFNGAIDELRVFSGVVPP